LAKLLAKLLFCVPSLREFLVVDGSSKRIIKITLIINYLPTILLKSDQTGEYYKIIFISIATFTITITL
jgi:hypothetical protein